MNPKDTEKGQPAFLLAQVGAHAATQFAERLGALHLSPPDAGILRLLRIAPGISQQELRQDLAAGKTLKEMGYANVQNLGGFKGWLDAGGEVEKT